MGVVRGDSMGCFPMMLSPAGLPMDVGCSVREKSLSSLCHKLDTDIEAGDGRRANAGWAG